MKLFVKKPIEVLLAQANEAGDQTLKRGLGAGSLTLLGIGGVIGAGIFVLTGQQAAINAGPAIVLSFVLAGFVCALAAMCYAELASMIPVAGSAYTYTYATLGEFIAWLIAWDLILEYGLAAATVSAGWAGHFRDMLAGFGMTLPHAWSSAPYNFDGGTLIHTGAILNLPAVCIVFLMGWLLITGITESAMVNNIIVSMKLLIVAAVICFGFGHIHPEYWHPLIPARIEPTATDHVGHFGLPGVLTAAGVIFFAYIGFEAVSTAAQEAKDPQRTMPIGILASLAICTVLYILMSLVITGLAPYASLNNDAPVARALAAVPSLSWLKQLVNVGVTVGLGSTILSLLYGQSRIFYAMSRDGLLPPMFGAVNPKTRTPIWGTVITSVAAGLVGGLFPIAVLGELVSMGTLLAFALICGGVLYLRVTQPDLPRSFKTPLVWVVAPLGVAGCLFLISGLPAPTWLRLFIWMAIGLAVYFGYAYHHSRQHEAKLAATPRGVNAELPIHAVLGELRAALADRPNAVLVAPPGAGKTTVVPLALLNEPWVQGGKLIVLEPRRLAARAAAQRMASSLGEPVGETVGFRVRLQSKVSARTQIEVVTEGVFTRMILDDPALTGVAAVLFDEFHERSLDADLGLAFARDAQGVLRDDLRLLVMSATLDGAKVAGLLDAGDPVESVGRAFPVETRYLGRDPAARIEDQAARAVRRALAEEAGGVLVFLPGQAEIRRTETLLAERLDPSIILAPLYGALDTGEQDRAIAPALPGQRKVVLATSIAETSLTLQGVRVVVDSGLARVPRFDPASGLTRLDTVRVSQASADQRRGRAGRTEPGVCYRLWEEAETRALPPFGRPEMLESDLAGVALDLAQWGARSPDALAFLDPPPAAAFAEARTLLSRLGALDAAGGLTPHGKAIARLPLPPRLAHMVVEAAGQGEGRRAAEIAAILSERGLGGNSVDLVDRLERFAADRGPRARDARSLADRWTKAAGGRSGEGGPSPALILAAAYPERIAQSRGKLGEFRLVNGRGVFMEPHERLAEASWLAVGELGGGAARDRILLAAELEPGELLDAYGDRIETEDRIETDAQGRVRAKRLRRLGQLVVEERLIDRPEPAALQRALLNQVRDGGLSALPWGEGARSLRARAAFLRRFDDASPDLSDEALLTDLDAWLAPLLEGRTALAQLSAQALEQAVRDLIPWESQRALDREAPPRFEAPTGSSIAIDYAAEAGPTVEVRVQELFGLATHPAVGGGKVPLVMALLSPARRPVQVTRDLPGFWAGSWKAVRADMRGRYPKHPWPENPLEAPPTTRAKPRGT